MKIIKNNSNNSAGPIKLEFHSFTSSHQTMDHSFHQGTESTSKRRRIDQESEISSHTPVVTSMEVQLSIPMEVIFRQVSSNNRAKPLLTRSEAQSMLRMNMLSQEIDVLVQLSSEAFNKKRWCNDIESTLVSHPVLRALLPLLHCHGKSKPEKSLAYIQQELSRILHEITTLSKMMHQFADQNYTLSESLLDALGGNSLAEEKRLLGDLEEEICKRCYEVLQMTETHLTSQLTSPSSMNEFCTKLFGEITSDPKETHMLTILEEEWQEAQSEKGTVFEDKEVTEISPALTLPSDAHLSLSTKTMSTAAIQTPESHSRLWERTTKQPHQTEHNRCFQQSLKGVQVLTPTSLIVEAQQPGDDVCTSSPSSPPAAFEAISISRQAEAIRDGTSQLLQTHNDPSNISEVNCDKPGRSSFYTATRNEYHRTDSQENRMEAAQTLIYGARESFQLSNSDEALRCSLQVTKSEAKVDSQYLKMWTCQQETTMRDLQHCPLPTNSLLFRKNAEQIDDEIRFYDMSPHTGSTTRSPPIIESDDDHLQPNSQNAVHALAGLSYGHV